MRRWSPQVVRIIRLPELALQSGMGMTYSHQVVRRRVRTFSITPGDDILRQRAQVSVIGTTGGRGPWEMFLGNLSALYYF